VSVQGEILLTWTKDLRSDQFDQADLIVKNVSHRIQIHGLSDEEKEAMSAGVQREKVKMSYTKGTTFSYGNANCEMCKYEAESVGNCCTSSGSLSDHKDLEAGRQQWDLSSLGVEWLRDHAAVERESSRFGSPESTSTETPEAGTTRHTRHFEEEPVAWNHTVAPPPSYTKADRAIPAEEALRRLEDGIAQGVGREPRSLMPVFFDAVNADASHMSSEGLDSRARLLAVAARMIRGSKGRPASTPPVEHVEAVEPVERSSKKMIIEEERSSRKLVIEEVIADDPAEKLRTALGREPLDADELALAINEARRKDADPELLQRAEDVYGNLVAKQKAALKLVEAIESRMIGNLRSALAEARDAGIIRGEFPDESSVGVIDKAEAVLEEEKSKAAEELEEAMKANGALKLQRAIAQAEEVGVDEELLKAAKARLESIEERKRRIALLKMSLATNDPTLLRTAIEECEKEGLDDEADKVDVNVAKQRLEEMEQAEAEA